MRHWQSFTLLGALVLAGLFAAPLTAQRGGHGPANRSGFGAPQLPPGTYLNGVPGPHYTPGLNGLPSFSNRQYQFGCYGNCNAGRGGRYSHSYVGFVPLFSGYTFPSYYSGFDDSGPVPPPVDPTTVALTNEVDRLRGDLDQIKAQSLQVPPAAPPAAPAVSSAREQPVMQPPEPATVIVLRDGRRFESTNYAIMDRTLWNFSARPVQKIPLASIDVSGSEKVNADRGVDFSVPIDSTK